MIPTRETIRTLDLVQYIIKWSRNISRREIVIYTDKKKNLIYKPISKGSDTTQEAGITIIVIK